MSFGFLAHMALSFPPVVSEVLCQSRRPDQRFIANKPPSVGDFQKDNGARNLGRPGGTTAPATAAPTSALHYSTASEAYGQTPTKNPDSATCQGSGNLL